MHEATEEEASKGSSGQIVLYETTRVTISIFLRKDSPVPNVTNVKFFEDDTGVTGPAFEGPSG